MGLIVSKKYGRRHRPKDDDMFQSRARSSERTVNVTVARPYLELSEAFAVSFG